MVDQRWTTSNYATTVDRFQHTYDRDSNPLRRTDVLHTALNESYTYDGLNRLSTFTQGTHTQNFTIDAQGNFSTVTTNGTGVNRTTNAQNEVTAVGAAALAYDSNGNTTKDDKGQTLIYDAWNRMVTIKNSGGTTIQTYGYDALGRRIIESPPGTVRHRVAASCVASLHSLHATKEVALVLRATKAPIPGIHRPVCDPC